MEQRFIEEMNAHEIMQFPEFHVHAVIQKRNFLGEWEVENVFFEDFDKEEDARSYADHLIRKYDINCLYCEITQAVDTLTGKENKRIFFVEPWRKLN